MMAASLNDDHLFTVVMPVAIVMTPAHVPAAIVIMAALDDDLLRLGLRGGHGNHGGKADNGGECNDELFYLFLR